MSGGGAASAALWIFVYDGSACWQPTLMSVPSDDVAAHDGSVAGTSESWDKPARIYGECDFVKAYLRKHRRYGLRAGDQERDFQSVRLAM